jgi:predicted transcriptional regulator
MWLGRRVITSLRYAHGSWSLKVERYQGVPLYLQTRAYVQRILKALGAHAYLVDATVTRTSASLALIRLPWRVK